MASTNPSMSSTPMSRRSIPILSEAKPMLEEKRFEATYRHAWPLLLGLAMLAGVSYGFAGLVQTYCLDEPLHSSAYAEENVLGESCLAVHHEIPWRELERKVRKCHRHEYYDPMHDDCQTCPAATPNDRVFAVFWETQKDCAMLVNDPSTRYVTHVYWAFATVDEKGNVAQSLQYWDDAAIMHCMAQLRMRCIKQLVSIGGADSRHSFFSLQEPKALGRFLQSSIDVVKKFDFDGIDMDDETGNSHEARNDWLKNQSPTVLKYLAGLRDGMEAIRKPTEPKYLLTWDEFPTSYDQPAPGYAGCSQVYEGGWRRCIPNEIKDLVDWVNIMYYNMPSNVCTLLLRAA
ncbi:hypothetical protein SDRG_17078 [Saprolegnia diclina VS20]|uniref:GH18 domain-containing protein n=1 Tax=Saprolegnia diclina (strain VS20) TaxID=1156394 RepID=T0PS35_SAPDV|nr:hypothetical protein SDRG_17078 [Saprolegnia diclina VS20]EQC25031.1 hypothetical protein SDRG_17078 [Saprolegnia diclina VS20]|eukprot:XP_008621535.1 hypothetical protein SDRG_17078 [Saprolegnia diclina VS20]